MLCLPGAWCRRRRAAGQPVVSEAASAINRATAPGCETVTAWEASISTLRDPGALAHEPLGLRRDGEVLQGHEVPGGDGPPRRLRGLVGQGIGDDGPLRDGHQPGDVLGHVGGEDLAELLLLDVEVVDGTLAGTENGTGRSAEPSSAPGNLPASSPVLSPSSRMKLATYTSARTRGCPAAASLITVPP